MKIGRFFVCNVLVIDRLHVKLKKLATGTRNAMQSLCNHLNTFTAAQHWAMDTTLYKKIPKGAVFAENRKIVGEDCQVAGLGLEKRALLNSEVRYPALLHTIISLPACNHPHIPPLPLLQ